MMATMRGFGDLDRYFDDPVYKSIYVSTDDFLYKLKYGWQGFAHGAPRSRVDDETTLSNGYTITREIWEENLKPTFPKVEPHRTKSIKGSRN
jgi:hypothetical protein